MEQSNINAFFKRIAAKLAILLGGAVVFGNTVTQADTAGFSAPPEGSNLRLTTSESRKIPAKLVLRKTKAGLKMIAQHSSHSSHASHASHGSHGSHASHASHSSHSSHSSRAM